MAVTPVSFLHNVWGVFDAILYGILVAAGSFVAWALLQGYWRGLGIYLVRHAGPRPLRASKHRIWRDPGEIESLDLAGGPGGRDGAPAPPFTFIKEHSSGSQPCVSVHDARGRRWRVKILVMLLSNWDTKDRRDVARGSNTAIFEVRRDGARWGGREAQYLITDWGGAMGKWGTSVVSRGRWDPAGFEAQTPGFATAAKDGGVSFAYTGQRTADITHHIPMDHVRWFHGIAGRLREGQLVEALAARGASEEEQTRFARALIDRIHQLGDVAGSAR